MCLGNTIHTIRSSNWLPSRPLHLEVGAHCSDGLLDPVDGHASSDGFMGISW